MLIILNYLKVVDFDNIIQDIRVCPGSNNDKHVFQHSDVRHLMLQLRENQEILEDEGKYYLIGNNIFCKCNVNIS